MRRLALPIAMLCAFLPFTASAMTNPLPKADFPKHTVQIQTQTLDDPSFDCTWSANCDVPVILLHSYASGCDFAAGDVSLSQGTPTNPADCLGRINGWMEGAATHPRTSKELSFAILGSTYDNEADTAGAALDFVQTSRGAAGFKLAKSQPNLLPDGKLGGSTILVYKSGIPDGIDAYLSLAFQGTAEVEAGATWTAGGHTQGQCLHWLENLTSEALAYTVAHPSSQ